MYLNTYLIGFYTYYMHLQHETLTDMYVTYYTNENDRKNKFLRISVRRIR